MLGRPISKCEEHRWALCTGGPSGWSCRAAEGRSKFSRHRCFQVESPCQCARWTPAPWPLRSPPRQHNGRGPDPSDRGYLPLSMLYDSSRRTPFIHAIQATQRCISQVERPNGADWWETKFLHSTFNNLWVLEDFVRWERCGRREV